MQILETIGGANDTEYFSLMKTGIISIYSGAYNDTVLVLENLVRNLTTSYGKPLETNEIELYQQDVIDICLQYCDAALLEFADTYGVFFDRNGSFQDAYDAAESIKKGLSISDKNDLLEDFMEQIGVVFEDAIFQVESVMYGVDRLLNNTLMTNEMYSVVVTTKNDIIKYLLQMKIVLVRKINKSFIVRGPVQVMKALNDKEDVKLEKDHPKSSFLYTATDGLLTRQDSKLTREYKTKEDLQQRYYEILLETFKKPTHATEKEQQMYDKERAKYARISQQRVDKIAAEVNHKVASLYDNHYKGTRDIEMSFLTTTNTIMSNITLPVEEYKNQTETRLQKFRSDVRQIFAAANKNIKNCFVALGRLICKAIKAIFHRGNKTIENDLKQSAAEFTELAVLTTQQYLDGIRLSLTGPVDSVLGIEPPINPNSTKVVNFH